VPIFLFHFAETIKIKGVPMAVGSNHKTQAGVMLKFTTIKAVVVAMNEPLIRPM
tara:strand:+ start:484 stop:645 length:162 start_codon:yes stop_codon:yes gene_type:complete